MSESTLLKIENLSKAFGRLRVLNNVSLGVDRGTITGLIGPNGAGKTTLFNTIAGSIQADTGTIALSGRRIDGLPAHKIFHAGLARTFQIPRPFGEMSVLENLLLVPGGQQGEHFWQNWLRAGAVARQEATLRAKAEQILEFTELLRLAHEPANALSGGQLKLLELARVLMSEPQLILLDEPAAGVNPTLLRTLVEKIQHLNEQGFSFLIIEHNMDLVMRICDPILALAQGKLIFAGDSAAAMRDSALIDAYLGEVAH